MKLALNHKSPIPLHIQAEELLRKMIADPQFQNGKLLPNEIDLANQLAITGTPSYVVGDEVVFGALGQQVLEEKVANIRTCQSATC